MNWVIITTGLIFLICVIVGLYRGAVKIAVSLVATVVTFILVFFLTPYVSQGIMSVTPLDEMIESQAEQSIIGMASSVLQGEGDEGETGLTVENVRRVLESAGITEAQLNAAGITVEDIVNGNVTSDELAQYGISSSLLDGLQGDDGDAESVLEGVEIPRDTQIAAIEGADIPGVFKALLLNNNNSEMYEELGARELYRIYLGLRGKTDHQYSCFYPDVCDHNGGDAGHHLCAGYCGKSSGAWLFQSSWRGAAWGSRRTDHCVDPLYDHYDAVYHFLWAGGLRRDPGK